MTSPHRRQRAPHAPLRIGCGAGYAGDRIEPAVELVEQGDLDYLVFECLAERTIALAQQAKSKDPSAGFDVRLEERMAAVLGPAVERRVGIITNMGAANPRAAGASVRDVAVRHGLAPLRIAIVTGDDVRPFVMAGSLRAIETGEPFDPSAVVSANAYLGAEPLLEALRHRADVIVTGRVADPSLFVAPIAGHFGWPLNDWPMLGRATLVGHLLECAGHVTGGYFADPGVRGGVKDVSGLERLGFPIAEVSADGTAVITKVPGSGGIVSAATCKEQLLYELHDPAAYVTPDTVADFSAVRVTDLGDDRVRVEGASGRARTETLKVSVGLQDGWIGEGQISYAGAGAVARARLAAEIVAGRLDRLRVTPREIRYDLIGVDALHGRRLSIGPDPYEVRLRVAAKTDRAVDAQRVAQEVEALYTNGPAGGGGATTQVRPVLAMLSTLIPRAQVEWRVDYEIVE